MRPTGKEIFGESALVTSMTEEDIIRGSKFNENADI